MHAAREPPAGKSDAREPRTTGRANASATRATARILMSRRSSRRTFIRIMLRRSDRLRKRIVLKGTSGTRLRLKICMRMGTATAASAKR